MVKSLSANIAPRLFFVLVLGAVIGLALYPNLRLPELAPTGKHTDFFYHMTAFLLLTASAAIAVSRSLGVVASMAAFAIILELLQAIVPGRGVFLIDAIASLLGVLLGVLLVTLAIEFWHRYSDA